MTSSFTIPRTRRFWWHYAEMLVAMAVGMVLLAPLWLPFGIERADLHALTMAANMTIGMAVWMRVRRHRWRPIAEMSAAMVAPFVLLLPPLWAGLLSEDGLFVLGHVLMLATMLAAMLLRPDEYAGHHH
jgi:flagellar biosynthetic protein FliP